MASSVITTRTNSTSSKRNFQSLEPSVESTHSTNEYSSSQSDFPKNLSFSIAAAAALVAKSNGYSTELNSISETGIDASGDSNRIYNNFPGSSNWFYSNSSPNKDLDSSQYPVVAQQFNEFFGSNQTGLGCTFSDYQSNPQSSSTGSYYHQLQDRLGNQLPFSASTPQQDSTLLVGLNGLETDSSSCEPPLTTSSSNTSNQTDKSSLLLTSSPSKDENCQMKLVGSYLGSDFYFSQSYTGYPQRVAHTEENTSSPGATVHYYDSSSSSSYHPRYNIEVEETKESVSVNGSEFFTGLYSAGVQGETNTYIGSNELNYGGAFPYYQHPAIELDSNGNRLGSPRSNENDILYNMKNIYNAKNYNNKFNPSDTYDSLLSLEQNGDARRNYVDDQQNLSFLNSGSIGLVPSEEAAMNAAASLMLGTMSRNLVNNTIVHPESRNYLVRSSGGSEGPESPTELGLVDSNIDSTSNTENS